jgi:hypothetical protein
MLIRSITHLVLNASCVYITAFLLTVLLHGWCTPS